MSFDESRLTFGVFHAAQKIRTIELDGKTVKLQIVSLLSFHLFLVQKQGVFSLNLVIVLFSSGTLQARIDFEPSQRPITGVQMASLSFMTSPTR